jgi:hypothetical protein
LSHVRHASRVLLTADLRFGRRLALSDVLSRLWLKSLWLRRCGTSFNCRGGIFLLLLRARKRLLRGSLLDAGRGSARGFWRGRGWHWLRFNTAAYHRWRLHLSGQLRRCGWSRATHGRHWTRLWLRRVASLFLALRTANDDATAGRIHALLTSLVAIAALRQVTLHTLHLLQSNRAHVIFDVTNAERLEQADQGFVLEP